MTGRVNRADRVAQAVADLGRAERDFARAVARDLGLSPVDLHALGYLIAAGSAGVIELGRHLGLSSAAATGLADRLETAGHAVRRPHPSDRRRLVLEPTDRAAALLFEHLRPLTRDTKRLADGFDGQELDAIEHFLALLIASYERHTAGASE